MTIRRDPKALIRRFRSHRILVVGDLMLDRYVSGTVARISPEAPVPVVRVVREQARPGGAANVAANIRALGGQVVMAGLVGNDQAGRELTEVLAGQGIEADGVLRAANMRTTVKMRILAERQQVVRVDYENPEVIDRALQGKLARRVAELVPHVDGVIIEDYGKGVVSQPVIDALLRQVRGSHVRVGLDPKDNRELRFSELALATPNFMEACVAAGLPHVPVGDEPLKNPTLVQAGKVLMEKWQCALLIITLGPQGMYLVSRTEQPLHIPTVAREVFDVSGAGDTVIATAMLAKVAGADDRLAAALANVAAGVVVAKVGTATCSAAELLAHLRDTLPRAGLAAMSATRPASGRRA